MVRVKVADVHALLDAAERGDTLRVARLLGASPAPDRLVLSPSPGSTGKTALFVATGCGHAAVVRLLLRHAAVPQVLTRCSHRPLRSASMSALEAAACLGHAAVAELLLQHAPEQQVLGACHGCTPLHLAASANHANVAQLLLRHSPLSQLAATNDDQHTPLMAAAQEGSAEVAQLLLAPAFAPEHQVQLTTPAGYSALMMAVTNGHEQVVSLLLQHLPRKQVLAADKAGFTALHRAASTGNTAMLKLLLCHDPEAQVLRTDAHYAHGYHPALLFALAAGHNAAVELLLHHAPAQQVTRMCVPDFTPLLFAVHAGDVSIVQQLLAHVPEQQVLVCDTSHAAVSPLMLASSTGATEVVQELLKVLPEQQVMLPSTGDGLPTLPLAKAVASGHVAVARLLLQHCPEQQLRWVGEGGTTMLQVAAAGGSAELIRLLLQYAPRQQVMRADRDGCTALIIASCEGHADVVAELLRYEPLQQLQATNAEGQCALDLALSNSHPDVLVHLLPFITDKLRLGAALATLLSYCEGHQLTHLSDLQCFRLLVAAGAGVPPLGSPFASLDVALQPLLWRALVKPVRESLQHFIISQAARCSSWGTAGANSTDGDGGGGRGRGTRSSSRRRRSSRRALVLSSWRSASTLKRVAAQGNDAEVLQCLTARPEGHSSGPLCKAMAMALAAQPFSAGHARCCQLLFAQLEDHDLRATDQSLVCTLTAAQQQQLYGALQPAVRLALTPSLLSHATNQAVVELALTVLETRRRPQHSTNST